MVQKINAVQRLQLRRKFQLANFTSLNAKSFKTYADFAAFEKEYRSVDLGASYLTDKADAEIMKYISISRRMINITIEQEYFTMRSALMKRSCSL